MSEQADTIREALALLPATQAQADALYAVRTLEAELARLKASPGCGLIVAERQRQIDVEKWTPEHDDGHAEGDLAEAAAALILNDETLWPWPDWWKAEDDQKRQLVKAGALIAAELDRIYRETSASGSEGDTA